MLEHPPCYATEYHRNRLDLFACFLIPEIILCENIVYKHIPATTGIPRHPYEGCTYCFIHEEAHTNVRFLSCDGHQLYERGVDLEVEGVHYIEMHREPAVYVLGPPPSRSRDLELEGGVIACHVDYVYEPQDSHVRGTE